MNPSFVVGLLAFLACFWLGNAGSSPKACPPIKKLFCPKYTRIQFDNGDRPRLMSCAYSCDPSAPHSCYFIEREESDCWNMDNARKGRCYNGICLDEATLAIRTANLRAVEQRGSFRVRVPLHGASHSNCKPSGSSPVPDSIC
ncbi:uncharacterized protein LOC135400275 isoform X2 [Ornithodoros turicata]|uniref:uncharacterized protein LOC135400275 isoform X2 n=1 Tax=Ornithodoros turicata TaxID=34597 RepID=UPI003139F1B4